MKKMFFVTETFIYGEQIEAESFEDAAEKFEKNNCLSDKADIDGSVYVVDEDTNEGREV